MGAVSTIRIIAAAFIALAPLGAAPASAAEREPAPAAAPKPAAPKPAAVRPTVAPTSAPHIVKPTVAPTTVAPVKPVQVPQAPRMPELTAPKAVVPAEIPAAAKAELPQRPTRPALPAVAVPPDVLAMKGTSVAFGPAAEALDAAAFAALDKVALRLAAKPDERLELQAHAPRAGENEAPARRLSLARAKAVREYLMSKGIAKERILVFALGSQGKDNLDRVDLAFK